MSAGVPAAPLARGLACNACGAPAASRVCTQCLIARYCNVGCQKADWVSGHKAICRSQALSVPGAAAGAINLMLVVATDGDDSNMGNNMTHVLSYVPDAATATLALRNDNIGGIEDIARMHLLDPDFVVPQSTQTMPVGDLLGFIQKTLSHADRTARQNGYALRISLFDGKGVALAADCASGVDGVIEGLIFRAWGRG
jgi:hypothetical protein